jgi:hypothetical protein
MIENEVHYDDICKSQELGQVIFSGYRNFTTALTLCQDVKGNLIEIESKADQQKAIEIMKTSSFCGKTWIAWWDENDEGNWTSAINSSKHLSSSSFQSWRRGEPNGDTLENCVSLHQDGKYVALNYKNIFYRMSFLQVNGWIYLVVIKSVLYVT